MGTELSTATVDSPLRGGYLVVGAGAIGCTVAAGLLRAGLPVTLVERDAEHRAALRARGIVFESDPGVAVVGGPRPSAVVAPHEVEGVFERALLCVKSQDTLQAAELLQQWLAPDGYVVSCQNGDNEPALIAALGAHRVVGAFVNIAADVVAPGVVRPGGVTELVVGELDGSVTPRLLALEADLPDMAVVSSNVQGAIWSKRALAAMYTATALADDDTATLIDRHRPLMRRLALEVVEIARHRSIRLADLGYFDPARLRDDTTAPAELDRLVEWQHGISKKRVGPFRDIAIRGRRTEAHSELHDLAAAGRAAGVPTPLVSRLDEMLADLETGARRFDDASLLELATSPTDRTKDSHT